jgi:hypothetical protein
MRIDRQPGSEPGTLYLNRDNAWGAVSVLAQSDPEWTYTVEPWGAGYAITVRDEDGLFLGYL